MVYKYLFCYISFMIPKSNQIGNKFFQSYKVFGVERKAPTTERSEKSVNLIVRNRKNQFCFVERHNSGCTGAVPAHVCFSITGGGWIKTGGKQIASKQDVQEIPANGTDGFRRTRNDTKDDVVKRQPNTAQGERKILKANRRTTGQAAPPP